ncbi:hypothetical protein [Streptomyces sp. NPDC058335]|uniref:hypothetical protein n=1 Tax=Streptomyces sp. NPDC058335 TaxID=3346451 RepID=UPI0036477F56
MSTWVASILTAGQRLCPRETRTTMGALTALCPAVPAEPSVCPSECVPQPPRDLSRSDARLDVEPRS